MIYTYLSPCLTFTVAVAATVVGFVVEQPVIVLLGFLVAVAGLTWLNMEFSRRRHNEDDYFYARSRAAELFWPFA